MDLFAKLETIIMPVAGRISSQRHMQAIRTGIVGTLPFTIVGSFFTILNNIPYQPYMDFIQPYLSVMDIPFRFTVGMLALYATFGIASSLAESYKLDHTSVAMLAVLAFLVTSAVPARVTEGVDGVITSGRWINIANLSASSLFGAIVTALVTVEIYRFMKNKNITIKMPAGVPPEVSNSFTALFPTAAVLLLFWVIRHILNLDINVVMSTILMPMKGLLVGNSLIGGLLTVFLITCFWILGIHGPAIMGPVIRPFWDIAIAENMEAFSEGIGVHALPNIFTEQFLQWFVWIGGAGSTLALVVLLMFSKSKYLKSLGKLGFLPGIFNINEPIIFGVPIVMNPILAIPFMAAPLVTTTIAYLFTVTNLVPLMMARLPFTMLAPIAAVMSTDWNVMAGVLVIINFIVSLIIYYPFFKIIEAQQLKKEENS